MILNMPRMTYSRVSCHVPVGCGTASLADPLNTIARGVVSTSFVYVDRCMYRCSTIGSFRMQ